MHVGLQSVRVTQVSIPLVVCEFENALVGGVEPAECCCRRRIVLRERFQLTMSILPTSDEIPGCSRLLVRHQDSATAPRAVSLIAAIDSIIPFLTTSNEGSTDDRWRLCHCMP